MRRNNFPWLTIPITAATFAIMATPLGPALQYEVGLLLHQPWRILTCHLAHWSVNHLCWSLGAFVLLGILCESRNRIRYMTCLLASATLIPLALLVLQPSLSTYRGLSGIDSALFFLAAIPIAREQWRDNRPLSVAAGLLLIGFFAKLAFEAVTGNTVFARSEGTFVPVPLAHLAGAAIGTVYAILPDLRRHSPMTLISTRLARRPSNSP